MELKKNPAKDIARKRGLFFSIGLTCSLSLVTLVFEYRTPKESDIVDLGDVKTTFDDIMDIPLTEQIPPPPVAVVQLPKVVEVPDEEEIKEEMEITFDVEINEQTEIEDVVYEVEEVEEEEVEEIFTIVEKRPEFPGGHAAMYEYLSKNLRYPVMAKRMGIEGRVFVQFVISKDGSISHVETIKGIGSGCDEEAERVIKSMPAWSPGKQRGKAVKVQMIIPVYFKLA